VSTPESITLTDEEGAIFTAYTQLPGTVVRDVDTLLAYIGTAGVPVSAKTSEFAIAKLPEINALLSEPGHIAIKRCRQVSYPHVDALHLLLRSSPLIKVDRLKTPRMVVNPGMLEQWQALNTCERYFALLDLWWRIADEEHGPGARHPATWNIRLRLNLIEELITPSISERRGCRSDYLQEFWARSNWPSCNCSA
jgi:hypothetical protein